MAHGSLKLQNISDETIENIMDVNLKGTIFCCKYLIPFLEKQENGGHIFTFEGAGSDGRINADLSIYGTSKYGLSYFTNALAKQMKNSNIGIHAIQPGMVITDLLIGGKDLPLATKNIFNILAEESSVVAEYIVPRVCKIEGNNQAIRFLTPFGVMWRFLTFFMRKNRFFDKEGNLVVKYK
jgi:NAD(P)-dependent dehydrogenase (short-subunit alcohol dehydrogenase family)